MAYLKQIIAILAFLSLLGGNLALAEVNPKSIHQLEMEKFQNYEVINNIGMTCEANLSNSTPSVSKTIYGFYPYWMEDAYTNFQWDLLTHVAYFSIEINSDGSLGDKHGWPNNTLLNLAHQNGVKLTLVAQNFTAADLSTLLSNSTYKNNLIVNLLSEVKTTSADGINIDFENVPSDQKSNLTIFMTDLVSAFKAENSNYHITIDVPAVDWADAFDENALANITDGLMIMAYDYHWSTGPTAGPISPYDASATWGAYNVVNTLNTYLNLTNNNKQKLILGVPYYGYDWPVTADAVPATTAGTGEAKTYAENRLATQTYARIWDDDSKTPYYKYGSFRQIWYEDGESLQYKYDLVNNQAISGIGIWALGYDGTYTDLWDKIALNFSEPKTVASPAGKSYKKYKRIILTATDANGIAATYYTLDGTTPTINSIKYIKPFRIFQDTALKFFSVDNLGNREIVREEDYEIVYNNKKFKLRKGLKNLNLKGKSSVFNFKKLPKKPAKYNFEIIKIRKKPNNLEKKNTLKGFWKLKTSLNKIKNNKKFRIKFVLEYKKKLLNGLKKKNLKLKYYDFDKNVWQTMPAVHVKNKNKFRIWLTNFKWNKMRFAISAI